MTYRLDSFNFLCAEFVELNPEMYPMATISLILIATQTKEIKKEIAQGPQFLRRVFVSIIFDSRFESRYIKIHTHMHTHTR